MLTISSGHSVEYLTDAVAQGRENYYTGAVAEGEPPGQWYGAGAESLGLVGEVDADVMKHLYGRFADPRDPLFADPETRDQAARLGRTPHRYRTAAEVLAEALQQEPDATPERVAELRLQAEKSTRNAVAFLDVTFSVQKSITVLHTAFEAQEVAARRAGDREAEQAWAAHRQAVEAAIQAGNAAALDYLADEAGYARTGHHGPSGGRFIDAHAFTVARFFQHTSRTNDPQLHIHNAVLNRAQCADGKWRTLDSRGIHRNRAAAGAIAERTMEEHLTRALGVRFATRADGKAREVVGIPQEVMDLFSARRRAITDKTRSLVADFEQRYGREPNPLELDRLRRQATFLTRPSKSHAGESAEQRLDRWAAQLRAEVDTGLAEVAHAALGHAGNAPVQGFSPRAVIQTALAEVQQAKATWTRSNLVRAVAAALPDNLGGLTPKQVRDLVESLTDQAIQASEGQDLSGGSTSAYDVTAVTYEVDTPVMPDELMLANGRSAYLPPAGRLYANRSQLVAERALEAAARRGGRAAISTESANVVIARYTAATGVELGADQAAAVRGVLTSGAAVEVLVGPAGTGKSRTVGALAAAWSSCDTWPQRVHPPRVFGLATSELATEVLAGEGLEARNIASFLACQARLANGRIKPGDERWRLTAGDLVVVDEASMVDTTSVGEIRRHVEEAGAKLLLTGDHRQLAAVGAGGAFELVARQAASYELAEVRRFTHEWERDASLRLRSGDLTAVSDYDRHGRLVDAGTVEQAGAAARRAWLADTLAGRRSLLLVDTNEQAAALSAQARAELVRLGQVDDEQTVSLGHDGNRAGVGDLVQARKLAPELCGYAGNTRGPLNRENYRITSVDVDGSLTVTPLDNGPSLTLPPQYVSEYLTLGYAATVHSAQGATVDTSHTVITGKTATAAAYVGMTRGRESNTAYVATVITNPDAPAGEAHQAERRSSAGLLAEVLAADEPDPAALIVAEQSRHEARSLATVGARIEEAGEILGRARHAALFDRLTRCGLISEEHRRQLAADAAVTALNQLLRNAELAGHDADELVTTAVAGRPLDGARSIAQVLHHRISEQVGDLTPTGDSFTERLPATPAGTWSTYVNRLGELADRRRHELGTEVAEQVPQWAIEALGPVPADPVARQEWEHRAGIVAAHRELTGWDDPAQPIGPAPKPGEVTARASWHAAWRALGRPEGSAEELEMSTGRLRLRVRAYEREEAWSPQWVGDELSATAQAAARWYQTATLAKAEAQAAGDPQEKAAAEQRAAEAEAMADLLAEQTLRLEVADQARGRWYAHTAATREAAHRARAELARRGEDIQPEDTVTAEEWLAAQAEAMRAEDPHRVITPADLVDQQPTTADLAATFDPASKRVDAHPAQVEATLTQQASASTTTGPVTASTTAQVPEQQLPAGVPTLAQTTAAVIRAQAALSRLAGRADLEARRQADEDTWRAELDHHDRRRATEDARVNELAAAYH